MASEKEPKETPTRRQLLNGAAIVATGVMLADGVNTGRNLDATDASAAAPNTSQQEKVAAQGKIRREILKYYGRLAATGVGLGAVNHILSKRNMRGLQQPDPGNMRPSAEPERQVDSPDSGRGSSR